MVNINQWTTPSHDNSSANQAVQSVIASDDATTHEWLQASFLQPTIRTDDIHGELIKFLLNGQDPHELIAELASSNVSVSETADDYLQTCLRYQADIGIANLLHTIQFPYKRDYYSPLCSVATRLIENEHMTEATRVISYLDEFAGKHPRTRLLRLKYLFRAEMLDELHELFARIPAQDYRTSEELMLLRIKYECTIGNPEGGLALLNELGPLDTLPPLMMRWAIDCLLSLGRHHDIVPLLEAWLSLDFCYSNEARRVLPIAASTGETTRLVRAIEQLHGWFMAPDLVQLRKTLLCNAGEQESVTTRHDQPSHMDTEVTGPPPATMTSHSLSRNACFFCTDIKFNIPTLIALTSLAMAISREESPPDIYVFTPTETLAWWEHIAHNFSLEFQSLTLRIVSTSPMSLDASRAHFGFHSFGDVLSTAVYARFYASRYLYRLGVARALYLDSDIIIQRSPRPLLNMDMSIYPLAARTEQTTPLIGRAIQLHDIPSNRYFNAGILLFNLQHPAAYQVIEQAIAYSEHAEEKLLFLDQCALNKAVRGLYIAMSENYNWFVRPTASARADHHQAAIVHFVGTPKPWDSNYKGQGTALWQQYRNHAARLFGEDVLLATKVTT
ncbi:glycosyltransferase family 8 protein [Dickeya dadantii]|uniref:glycosyltransferase family 8 protein n=1 Tax=Dickeya dadantii TaxID=204038 RepID=UPI0021DAD2C4|nr:glycosyltransferase [Dickeya dadantii]